MKRVTICIRKKKKKIRVQSIKNIWYLIYTVKTVQTKQIPLQSLLYKTTTCLKGPATTFFVTFFVSQIKKNLSKTTTTKLYPAKKVDTKIS